MDTFVKYYLVWITFLLSLSPSFQTSSLKVTWDTECGKTVGCFPDCRGGCDYLVTWKDTGSHIDFTLNSVGNIYNGYLAIAFSDDRRMGDDSVVACIVNPSSNGYVVSGYNKGDDNDILSPPDYGLVNTSVPAINGILSCSFRRNKTAADSRFFNLNDDYIIQLVVGEIKSKHGYSKLGKHDNIPWFSERKVDFQSLDIVGAYKLSSPLVKTHGIMMVLAWLLFSLIGMLTARYNRDMLPETKLFGTKVWFQIHRAVMVAVVICVIVGFITIFVEVAGYSQVTPGEAVVAQSHPVLGIIVTCITLLNPIGALFRPGPDHELRWVFNWVHFGLGVLSQVLAVITIFFGFFTDRAELSVTPALVTVGHLICTLTVIVFLEARKHMGADKINQEATKTNKKDLSVQASETEDKSNRKMTVPMIALVVSSILTLGFTLGILGIIASN